MSASRHQPFELFLYGGAVERRYRRLRPEVESLPWGTLHPEQLSPQLINDARQVWTSAAFQEHRTGAACASTLRAMIAARVPLDLIAMATRFPLDEMVHVELCARVLAELGGAAPLPHDPEDLFVEPSRELSPLMQAAESVVRVFCVGEAFSVPMIRGAWRGTSHPLIRAVLGRIARDEAAHGQLGWLFLDWADEQLSAEDRRHLGAAAAQSLRALRTANQRLPREAPERERLGWMANDDYLELAERTLRELVIAPLRERGIDPGA
jgi:hypothetical protein